MAVDSAYRRSGQYKSKRKPKGGKSPSAKRKKVSRAGAKAAPSYASERYGPGTKRKSTRKPGGSAAAAKKRKTKAMSEGAGKSAPSYIKTKPNVKKPNEHKSKKPKPRIEHQGRRPKPRTRNVAHGGGSGMDAMSISDKFYKKALGAALDKGIKKAAAQKVKEKTKGRSTYKKGGGIR